MKTINTFNPALKNSLNLLIILCIAFTSCEGRKAQNQALSESIEEFKKKTTLETIKYIPKTYNYKEIDTTLVNGFSIYQKLYIDMENSVLTKKETKDSILHKTFLRKGKSDVIIKYNNTILFSDAIDKTFITNYDKSQKDLLKDKILCNVFIEESYENQTNTESTTIVIQFFNPIKAKEEVFYALKINSKGKYSIQKIKNTYQLYTY